MVEIPKPDYSTEFGTVETTDDWLSQAREHARKVCSEVWPAGTVKPGENTTIRLSSRMKRTRGYCYYRWKNPDGEIVGWSDRRPDAEKHALIRIKEDYALTNVDGSMETLRHELIHAWQYHHENGDTGHGPTFKRWLDDCRVDY